MQIAIFFFFVYFVSLHVSVAAMEISMWLFLLPGVFLAVRHKKILWPSKLAIIGAGGLFATALISFFININKPEQLLDYAGEFRWIIIYWCFLQFYSVFFERLNFSKLILAGQITLLVAGFYSFYQFFSGHDFFRSHVVFHYLYDGSPYFRPNSFFGLPTTYAYASAMFLSLSLTFWIRERNKDSAWVRRIRFAYFIISPLNIFISFTRAAWIAATVSALTVLRLTRNKYFFRIAMTLGILIVAMYTSFSSFRNRVNSMGDPAYVANENRIYLWKANWMIFEENPFFGLGFEENRKQIDIYLDRLNKPDVMRNHPHNTYLNFLAGLGIFGLGFFLLFVGYHLKTTLDGIRTTTNYHHKTLYIGALGAQMIVLIGGLTECCFEDSELTHQFILLVALVEFLKLTTSPTSRFRRAQSPLGKS